MGSDVIAEEKMEHGKKLRLLGVDAKPNRKGVRSRPCRKKARKWRGKIGIARKTWKLLPGPASKLTGGLQRAGSHIIQMRH